MKEGTISVLCGCHNPLFHGLWTLMAWRLEYKSWPKWWQLVGIFLHDIGVWGRQYLSDDEAKDGHWFLGAIWAQKIVYKLSRNDDLRAKTLRLVAGHCPEESGVPESLLARPDKRSWVVAPMWWLWCNYWVEWYRGGHKVTPPPLWKKLVAENIKREKPIDSHQLYVNNRLEKKR